MIGGPFAALVLDLCWTTGESAGGDGLGLRAGALEETGVTGTEDEYTSVAC